MDETLKVAEVARRLRVDARTVYRLIDRGELRGVRVGRLWRIPIKAVERYLGQTPEQRAEEWARQRYGKKDYVEYVHRCPECGLESLVDAGGRYRCFNEDCGQIWRRPELEQCTECQELLPTAALKGSLICEDCLRSKVASDHT